MITISKEARMAAYALGLAGLAEFFQRLFDCEKRLVELSERIEVLEKKEKIL